MIEKYQRNCALGAVTGLSLTLAAIVVFSSAGLAQNVDGGGSAKAEPERQGRQSNSQTLNQTPEAATQVDAPSAISQSQQPDKLNLHERFTLYRRSIFTPFTIIAPALGAGFGQWEDEPPEWGQGAAGFGRRFGSNVGRRVIGETIRFGVAAADGEDPRFVRSQESGIWKRTMHAVGETFTSRTADGGRMPAYSRFAGIYGAAFAVNSWYPESRATTGRALRRGTTALGASVGFNVLREFFPRKHSKHEAPKP